MEKKGLNWIWPAKKDILSYSKGDILKTINKPETKNKRGLFVVTEMSNYST